MNHIYQWNKKSSPYNSLNIYAKYLGTLIEKYGELSLLIFIRIQIII